MTNILKILNDVGIRELSDDTLNALAKVVSDERKRRSHATKCQNFSSSRMLKDVERTFGKFKKDHFKFDTRTFNQQVFENLILSDWSSVYENTDDTLKHFYVYMHHYPNKSKLSYHSNCVNIELPGLPFYVGKGSNDRAYDLKRNQGHGEIIRNLLSDGFTSKDIVTIVATDLCEQKAYEIESKLIYFFGTIYEQDRHGLLVNLDIPKRPF